MDILLKFILPLLRLGRIGWHFLVRPGLEADILCRKVSIISHVRCDLIHPAGSHDRSGTALGNQ